MKKNPRAEIEQFLAFMPLAVALLDNKQKVIFANPSFEELMGISSHFMGEKDAGRLFSANPHILKIIKTSGESRAVYSETKSLLYRWGKKPLPVEISAAPASNMESFPNVALILIIKDKSTVSEIENREEKNEMIRNMETFSQWLIHEIRNPLGSIKGAAQMISRDRNMGASSKEFVDIILSEVTRLNRLSGEISFFMSNKKSIFENINIHSIVDRILNIMALDSAFGDVVFRREYDPSLPEIMGNVDELIQLFQNILKNAAESQECRGEIGVRTKYFRTSAAINLETGKHGFVAVEVIDSGAGIPSHIKEKLFVPFFTTKKEGTGLGLAICLKIVTKHEGSIEFEERKEGGTLCRVLLPFAKD